MEAEEVMIKKPWLISLQINFKTVKHVTDVIDSL